MKNVPLRYRGLWQRVLLRDGAGRVDTTTKVYWMQMASLYCDIRVPLNRIDCSDFSALTELDAVHRAGLAVQAGFAGQLEVEEAQSHGKYDDVDGLGYDLCHWHRYIDYQPDNGETDVGWMHYENARLVERGVHADYHEEWIRVAEAQGVEVALELVEVFDHQGVARPARGYLLVCGDYFMHALARTSDLPTAGSLAALMDQHPEPVQQRVWLDFIIDFGRRKGGQRPWDIRLSTVPFREQHSLFDAQHRLCAGPADDWFEYEGAHRLRRWCVREWTSEFDGFDMRE